MTSWGWLLVGWLVLSLAAAVWLGALVAANQRQSRETEQCPPDGTPRC